jgi:hypothetical protein
LIHRTAEESADNGETEDSASSEDGQEIELDDEALAAISEAVTQSAFFTQLSSDLSEIKALVGELVVERETNQKEIARLNQEVERLSKDENEKKTEYLQDLPTRRRTHITHRPRQANDNDGVDPDMAAIANKTLGRIAVSNRY